MFFLCLKELKTQYELMVDRGYMNLDIVQKIGSSDEQKLVLISLTHDLLKIVSVMLRKSHDSEILKRHLQY